MRDHLAGLACWIYIKLKGDREMMAMLFACRIVEGRSEFAKVPRLLKQQGADILINDFGMPELVPAGSGGTAEGA